MQLVSAESETTRPIQTPAIRSSLLKDALATADQARQKVEDLGLDRLQFITTAQLASVGIKRIVVKEVEHLLFRASRRQPYHGA